jgi:hypothetical protein
MLRNVARTALNVLVACCVLGAAFALAKGVPLQSAQSCDQTQVAYGSVCAASSTTFGQSTKVTLGHRRVHRGVRRLRITLPVQNGNGFRIKVKITTKITFKGGRTKTVTKPQFTIAARRGKSVILSFKLNRRGKLTVRRARLTTVTMKLTDPAGRSRTIRVVVRLA